MTEVTLKDIFRYEEDFSHLSGFPDTDLVTNLENVLGTARILKSHRRRVGRRNVVDACFSSKYVNKRQEFFQQIDSNDYKLEDKFFEKIDETSIADYNEKNKAFLEICAAAEEIKTSLRKELLKLNNVTEAKKIRSKLCKFDSDLESLLKTIQRIDNLSTFYINIKDGIIAPVSNIPANTKKENYSGIDVLYEEDRWPAKGGKNKNHTDTETEYILDGIFDNVKFRLKGKALEISKRMKLNFREKLMQFVKRELRFSENRDNVRSNYETLMLPLRIWERYKEFLEKCDRYNVRRGENIDSFRGDEPDEAPDIESRFIPDAIYPVFSNRYDIKGLFPLKLMRSFCCLDDHVPIDFEAKSNENKFLLAGLHSGGKSFFLENIILTSLVGQIGLKIPAEKLILPKYNHLFYFRNDENKYAGRLESELRAVNTIIETAKKGDLVVIDEFLDSTSPDIASWLGTDILGRLLASEATVFVSSHRDPNYKKLQKQGWIILSPNHKLVDGEIRPTYTLSRKLPDVKINKLYVQQLYAGLK
jgi:hypothetical protein